MASQQILRRRNAAATKDRILEAAKEAFARFGYSHAGIREIASAAGVQSTLVGRYFGSKAGLFEASLLDGLQGHKMDDIVLIDREEFGKQLADRLLKEETDIHFPLVVLSTADANARRIGNKVVQEHILPPLVAWLGPPHATVRALNLYILCSGFAIHVRQVRFDGKIADIDPLTIEWFAKSAQIIVDQSVRLVVGNIQL